VWTPAVSIAFFYDTDLLGAIEGGPARTTVVLSRRLLDQGPPSFRADGFGTYTLGETGATGRQTAGCTSADEFLGDYLTVEGIALYNATQSCEWAGEMTLSVPEKKMAYWEYDGGWQCRDDLYSLVGGDFVSGSRAIGCSGSSYYFALQRNDGASVNATAWTVKSKWCQQTPYIQMLFLNSDLPILRSTCEHEPEHMKFLQRICIANPNLQPDDPCTNSGFSLSPGGGGGAPTGIGIAEQTESPINETTGAFLVQWQNPILQYKFTPREGDEFASPGRARYDAVITIKPYAIENTAVSNYLAEIADVASVVKSGVGGCDINGPYAFAGRYDREDLWNAGYDFQQWQYVPLEYRVVVIQTGQCLSWIFKHNNDGGPKCSVSVSKVSGENVVQITRGAEGTAFTLEGLPHPDPDSGTPRECILRLAFGGRVPPLDFIVRQFE
jgi:hypothetical protein